MKPLLASFCALLLASTPTLPAADDPSTKDALGSLALGQKQADVIKFLGQPKSKGKDIEWEALGEHVQEWNYPAQDLTLNMNSIKQGGKKTILTISAGPRCTLATKRGIKIGSTLAEVKKAYGQWEDTESGEPGKLFVAGSMYGGILFHFKNGKVSEIFFGAAAE